MQSEFLKDGAVRVIGSACRLLCLRPKPGTLLTVVDGQDSGEFGRWLADFVEAEYRRFGIPVTWFIDAGSMQGAAHEVFLHWIEWLRGKPAALRHLYALVGSERTKLTMSMAQHLASAENAMSLHTDRERWVKLLHQAVPGWTDLPFTDRFEEVATDTRRTVTPEGGVALTGGPATFTFRRLSPTIVFSTFAGDDSGALAHLPFDELQTLIAAAPGKIKWFLDLSQGRVIASSVVEEWTQWLAAHRQRFSAIGMLAPTNALPLVLAIAKYRSGTDKLTVYRSAAEFETALKAHARTVTQ